MKYIKYGHGKWYTYYGLLCHALSLISSDVKDSPGAYTKQETKEMLDIFSKQLQKTFLLIQGGESY